jgi:uncharacterized protein YndB with AHSA1/START domain
LLRCLQATRRSVGAFEAKEETKMEKSVVEVETHIAAKPDEVWAAMTNRQSPMFMGATMDTDWKPGSGYVLKGEWEGRGFTDYGKIETALPGRELSFTHWSKTPDPPESYNAVRYQIVPDGSGSRVTLAQFQRGKELQLDDKTKAEFKKNWSMMLDALKAAAEA